MCLVLRSVWWRLREGEGEGEREGEGVGEGGAEVEGKLVR